MGKWCAHFEGDIEDACLPSTGWRRVVDCDDSCIFVAFYAIKAEESTLVIEKCVRVAVDISVSVSAHGRVVKSFKAVTVIAVPQLTELLARVDALRLLINK